ncbi:MAG: DnaD domain protein [Dehalococcoidia bacterium]|nr:DnaD domain protein [Dehalococcoidia bacterium]
MPDRRLSSSQAKSDFISLPDSFFTRVIPGTQDLAELKVVLYVCYLIGQKQARRGPTVSGVTYGELKSEIGRLSAGLDEEALRPALNSAVEHGALTHSTLDMGGTLEDVYGLPTPLVQNHGPAANVFALYEQNIGMLTPMIAEELKEAEQLYPPNWIEDAFKEAVALNKRSWRYISRILERWASEGKDSGEHKRDAEKDGPDKYVKGRYGHLVRR